MIAVIGSLAQLGEHYLDKVGVAGSNPVGTIFYFFKVYIRLKKIDNITFFTKIYNFEFKKCPGFPGYITPL